MAEQLFNRVLHLNNVRLRYAKANQDPLLKQVEIIVQSKLDILNAIYSFEPKNVLITGLPMHIKNAVHLGYIDEENDVIDGKYDLIISNLSFHYLNDIQKVLQRYKERLAPSGVLIVTFFGEENLIDLKRALIDLEVDATGGASQRFIPTIQVKDAARLFAQAGFKNVVSDKEEIVVAYPNMIKALRHIKKLGQTMATTGYTASMDRRLYHKIQEDIRPTHSTYNLLTVTGAV